VLGVDVGGTFTDFVYVERRDGATRLHLHKRPSTPEHPEQAVLLGLAEMDAQPETVVHGSTVATNAVLERKGAVTALVTSEGCRDILAIGRQARPRLYELTPSRPPALVPDELRFELAERVDNLGNVLVPLDPAGIEPLLERLGHLGVESLAVSFLFSFLRPEHEEFVASAARKRSFYVSASNEISPEYREYERTSTTALNAYVGPVMARYLGRLSDGLREQGVRHVRIIQSDGGSASAASVSRLAVRTLLSGPAGGVRGAFAVAKLAGHDHIITFDMGGTSTDVGLCPGRVLARPDAQIGELPVRTPVTDIHTVGAGGGSIARLDAGGALRVGPESVGADPGPACYGRGELPAVTDAHLVLGRLLPDRFLGGRARLDESRARAAIATIAGPYGGDLTRTAAAVVSVATTNMVRGIRVVSVERGYDPRQFTLVSFGGAGPLHACDIATALRMTKVLIPAFPGVLSAFGMAGADITKSYARSLLATVQPEAPGPLLQTLDETFAALMELAVEELTHDGVLRDEMQFERVLELRYAGQSFELSVPLHHMDIADIVSRFHRAHQDRYGHSDAGRQVEIVTARLQAVVPVPLVEPPRLPDADAAAPSSVIDVRAAWFGSPQSVSIHDRSLLGNGSKVQGPAIVTQMDATCIIPPRWSGRCDGWGNLVLEYQ
jgi:N-methylhydantoinase A